MAPEPRRDGGTGSTSRGTEKSLSLEENITFSEAGERW